MGKKVFLKIQKNIYDLNLKIACLALPFFVSGTVSGLIKTDLVGFWLLFFALYIFFPKPGPETKPPNGIIKGKGP